nr:Ty3/gypsy retrotransposon protein [Tanacetum cinerariifolium]
MMFEDDEQVMAAFMALSQPVLGLLDDLRKENESLEELKVLHQKLESGDGPLRFRRLPITKGFTIIVVEVDRFTKYAHFGTLPTSFNDHQQVLETVVSFEWDAAKP